MSFQPSFAGPQPDSRIDRTTFIRRAYLHLAVAIVGFIVLSAAWSFIGVGEYALDVLLAGGRYSWLVVLGAFMLVGMLATRLADNAGTNQTQLIGLGIYVLAESLIFAPLLTVAAITTLLLVGGLTFTAFSIKKDFSFLRSFLTMAGFIAFGAIIASVICGFSLGVWFSALMVLLCAGFILYDTSNIIHHYPTDRPAGAALHLFASIATMFWYILRIFMSRN
ncbi:Bax inhibitor-1/YccA family protein [Salmonella enterica]|nr:Bax inhibitor-1/YccA family protein [Salmonella enterica]EJV8497615.1 Bax inhibitor-1/YccA family protein [Salmonella enterica]EKP8286551.1 Bax inhibitor-1/YccA family protein [Salmonella enterica]EKR8112390.1 Bax inhibitor-1/YccA family protein [Salmonella enterica]EKS4113274.1 Bax inhibitor-1/YccA family protein [Salmonella enterica]